MRNACRRKSRQFMVFSVYIIVEKRVIDIYVDTLRCFLSTLLSTSRICRETMILTRKKGTAAIKPPTKKAPPSGAPLNQAVILSVLTEFIP